MTITFPPRLLLAFVLMMTSLAACGDAADELGGDDPVAAAGSDATAAAATEDGAEAAGAEAQFPVTVTDDRGEVTIPDEPRRIVSLSASLTEILYAVGAGDQVVAVDRYSDHPAGTPMTDLSGFRPNVEAIAAHQPDLVLVSSDRDGAVETLRATGVPTVLLTSARTVQDTYRAIEIVGAATGHPDRAAATVSGLRARIDELVASVPDGATPISYYYELSDDLHSVTSATYIGELLALAGLHSIADAAPDAAGGYPQLNAEFILGADPEVVFLARTDEAAGGAQDAAARPGWDRLSAVQAGRVVTLDPDVASRWGPRIVDLLEQVIAATGDLR